MWYPPTRARETLARVSVGACMQFVGGGGACPFVLGLPVARVIQEENVVDVLGHFATLSLVPLERQKPDAFAGFETLISEEDVGRRHENLDYHKEETGPRNPALRLPTTKQWSVCACFWVTIRFGSGKCGAKRQKSDTWGDGRDVTVF